MVLITLLFLSINISFAQIQELTNGLCWIEQVDVDYFKIASFQTGKSHQLTPYSQLSLSALFREKLATMGKPNYPNADYKMFFQCNENNSDLILNIQARGDVDICARAEFHDNEIIIKDLYSNYSRSNELCPRLIPLQIIIYSKNIPLVSQYLKNNYNEHIEELNEEFSYLSLTLKNNWLFREQSFMEKLMADLQVNFLIQGIEQSQEFYIPGDSLYLLEGQI